MGAALDGDVGFAGRVFAVDVVPAPDLNALRAQRVRDRWNEVPATLVKPEAERPFRDLDGDVSRMGRHGFVGDGRRRAAFTSWNLPDKPAFTL